MTVRIEQRVCSECGDYALAKGLCAAHYQQRQRAKMAVEHDCGREPCRGAVTYKTPGGEYLCATHYAFDLKARKAVTYCAVCGEMGVVTLRYGGLCKNHNWHPVGGSEEDA